MISPLAPDAVQHTQISVRNLRILDCVCYTAEPGPFHTPRLLARPHMEKRFFVYLLANRRHGVLYVGVTNNLGRRISEHKAKLVPGFTNTYGVSDLVYFEEYPSISEARSRERLLKRWRREWKFKLVEEMNPDWADLSNQIAM